MCSLEIPMSEEMTDVQALMENWFPEGLAEQFASELSKEYSSSVSNRELSTLSDLDLEDEYPARYLKLKKDYVDKEPKPGVSIGAWRNTDKKEIDLEMIGHDRTRMVYEGILSYDFGIEEIVELELKNSRTKAKSPRFPLFAEENEIDKYGNVLLKLGEDNSELINKIYAPSYMKSIGEGMIKSANLLTLSDKCFQRTESSKDEIRQRNYDKFFAIGLEELISTRRKGISRKGEIREIKDSLESYYHQMTENPFPEGTAQQSTGDFIDNIDSLISFSRDSAINMYRLSQIHNFLTRRESDLAEVWESLGKRGDFFKRHINSLWEEEFWRENKERYQPVEDPVKFSQILNPRITDLVEEELESQYQGEITIIF